MTDDLDDVRPVRPVWAELEGLVRGARRIGFTEEQVGYLMACLGVCWATAWHRATQSLRAAKEGRDKHV
jgi:hypothetical protein